MVFVWNSDNPHQRTICAAEQQRDDRDGNNDKMLNSDNPYQRTNAQQHTTSRSKRTREGWIDTRETATHDDNDANGFDVDDFFNSDNDLDQV